MEMTSTLKEVLKALDDAEVPAELRVVAFERVFDALMGGARPTQPAEPRQSQPVVTRDSGGEGLDAVAARLQVGRDVVDGAYYLDGDNLEIVVPPGRFDNQKSRATEQIAILVAAGRQALGLDDDWTSVDPIREQCEHFKRYDSSNFAATIKGMDKVFTVRGAGRDRKVRMTAPAWQKAAELLKQLAGES